MELRNGSLAAGVRLLAIAIPLVVAGLVAWGQLSARIEDARQRLEAKADRETVTVQYQAILEQLRVINQRLERLEARR
jgi:hypothetical protein